MFLVLLFLSHSQVNDSSPSNTHRPVWCQIPSFWLRFKVIDYWVPMETRSLSGPVPNWSTSTWNSITTTLDSFSSVLDRNYQRVTNPVTHLRFRCHTILGVLLCRSQTGRSEQGDVRTVRNLTLVTLWDDTGFVPCLNVRRLCWRQMKGISRDREDGDWSLKMNWRFLDQVYNEKDTLPRWQVWRWHRE